MWALHCKKVIFLCLNICTRKQDNIQVIIYQQSQTFLFGQHFCLCADFAEVQYVIFIPYKPFPLIGLLVKTQNMALSSFSNFTIASVCMLSRFHAFAAL